MTKTNPAYTVDKNKVVPKKEIIEHFVKYYGEEYREQISKRINSLNVDLLPMDLAGFKIKEAFKEKYKEYEAVDWEQQAEAMLSNLRKMVDNNKQFNASYLKTDADILTALGFDVSKIFAQNKETGKVYLANTDETKRLYNYIKASRKEKNIKPVNVEDFIESYTLNSNENDAELSNYKLDNKTKSFLQDICTSKGPIEEYNDNFAQYFIDGVNKLFGKNLKSVQEFLDDKTLDKFHKILKNQMKKSSFELNKNNIDNKNYGTKVEEDMELFNATRILGGFQYGKNRLVLPLDTRLNMNTVLHEINHALGNKEYNQSTTNFNKASIGLNEIVNEYLTLKSNKNMESFKESNLSTHKENGYSSIVKFMEKFLDQYEPILKKCQMSGNSVQVMKSFIGENNFKRLIGLCDMIEKQNFCQIILEKSKGVENLEDLLNNYRQNPNNPLFEKNVASLKLLDSIDNFTSELIEHYSEFEQGKISDIKLRKTNVQEQENVASTTV